MTAIHDGAWGTMTALDGYEVNLIPLEEATAGIRTVPASLLETAETLSG